MSTSYGQYFGQDKENVIMWTSLKHEKNSHYHTYSKQTWANSEHPDQTPQNIVTHPAVWHMYIVCQMIFLRLYGPLPSLLFVRVCLGGPDPGTRDPACCRMRVPGDEYRALRPVGQDKTSIEARGPVLPLLGGRLDHTQTLFLWQIRGGNQGQGLRHHLFGRVRWVVSPAAGVQRDFDASAAPGLYIGMQEGASQMLVRAVDIVGQMATNGFADLARLEVRYDLVVCLRSDHVPGFACAHPCADMVPNAAGVRQYRGHVCAHGGGQVALLAKTFGSAARSRTPEKSCV